MLKNFELPSNNVIAATKAQALSQPQDQVPSSSVPTDPSTTPIPAAPKSSTLLTYDRYVYKVKLDHLNDKFDSMEDKMSTMESSIKVLSDQCKVQASKLKRKFNDDEDHNHQKKEER
ncbi:hypothetical protein L6452_17842 [Arctium lappa]|uniref:Uncharacterized protein n=1 Tax=Arctium lappa TaxID=4217 RepID=A0ACB9C4P2_ARCLA|nr:hypothetical protein L6452_17842 [Arctium lappa]